MTAARSLSRTPVAIVPLGTVEVRQYLGERSELETPASIDVGSMFENAGPLNRYRDILFIEKEGFSALVAHALIAERFDIGIMSTKGMSVTAARMLLDRLAPHIDRVFVLHDFDVSGFSIFGTLGTSSRRYRFHNKVRIVDLGLRLTDIQCDGPEVGAIHAERLGKARRYASDAWRDAEGDQPPPYRACRTERDAVGRVRAVPRAQADRVWRAQGGAGRMTCWRATRGASSPARC